MTTHQIGKYRIIERIGRGGMGSVYKAHDPVLDRMVALKVISSETDHTDEIRARFFREAQACAKLSHPNIVTLHDVGEADGNLFIVMELLEGDELRQLIARRSIVHLADKFPLMIQICDGLAYAHDKGIIHRDIKPGNIFVLRSGQVKILDFGIAYVAAAETGLTRAGLIVGTLQYMAPERARGGGGRQSDIFSVGAVFYELLTNRPPFTGQDPIEILEKLRSQDPERLAEVEPSLPADLVGIVERALEKDPARRFPTLAHMRAELQAASRKHAEATERIRRDVQAGLHQVHELREELVKRLGGPWAEETESVIDDQAPLTTLERVRRDTATRIERFTDLLERADTLRPALESGTAAAQAGDFERAIADLTRVVREMPEHTRAGESLKQAQQELAARRERARLDDILAQAKAAYDAREYARCLEILSGVGELSMSPVADEIKHLRNLADGGIAREKEEAAVRLEARRRASESAAEVRLRAERARAAAESAEAQHWDARLWDLAETKLAEGRAALIEEAYAPAERDFEDACQLYERAETIAREGRAAERRSATHPNDRATGDANLDETIFVSVPTVAVGSAVETPRAFEPPPTAEVPLTIETPFTIEVPLTTETPLTIEVPLVVETPVVTATPLVIEPGAPEPSVSARRTLPGRPPNRRVRRYVAASIAVLALGAATLYVGWPGSSRQSSEPAAVRHAKPDTQPGAAGDAKQESEQAAARGAMARMQQEAAEGRDRATKADATGFAADAMAKAQAAEAEGARLSAAGNLPAATLAYQQAAGGYEDAARRAQVAREQRDSADAARTRMAGAKQRASSAAPSYARAIQTERQGNAHYQQKSYAEAAASFATATEMFTSALPPPVTKAPPAAEPTTALPVAATPRDEIRRVLSSFVEAVERRDIDGMRRIRPGMTDDDVRRIRNSNAIKRSHKVDLRVDEITISGDEAQARGRREDDIVLTSGERLRQELSFAYTLKRGAQGWVIQDVREFANRAPSSKRAP